MTSVPYPFFLKMAKVQLRVEQLRREYRYLLSEMFSRREEAEDLSGAVSLFLKVTKSYWKGLFQCYRYPQGTLPRTNNDLEHCFGSARYAERRASGRKGASSGGKRQRARGGRHSHTPGRFRCPRDTPHRHTRMANAACLTREQTREPPGPATLQEGPRCLPRQARGAATQAGFAVLVFLREGHLSSFQRSMASSSRWLARRCDFCRLCLSALSKRLT